MPDADHASVASQGPGAALREGLRRLVPADQREFAFRVRRLGLRKATGYRRLERRRERPRAGEPFDLGGGRSIVVPASVVHAVASHWTDYGHSIRELEAFKRIRRDASAFFDVGAAEGIFSAAFCALGEGTAWAFEPSPVMQERLGDLRSANPDLDIRLQPYALGEAQGTQAVSQYVDGQFAARAGATATAATMPVRTMDTFAAEQGVRADLLKVDVEGMELAVLRGADDALRDVRHILLELHHGLLPARGESTQQVQALLANAGFDVFTLEGDRIADLTRFARGEREVIPGYTIVVASRRPPA